MILCDDATFCSPPSNPLAPPSSAPCIDGHPPAILCHLFSPTLEFVFVRLLPSTDNHPIVYHCTFVSTTFSLVWPTLLVDCVHTNTLRCAHTESISHASCCYCYCYILLIYLWVWKFLWWWLLVKMTKGSGWFSLNWWWRRREPREDNFFFIERYRLIYF